MIQYSDIFHKNATALLSDKRFIINRGGTRSGKTYSLIILIIAVVCSNKNTEVLITRKTLPSIKGTVLKDFLDISKKMGIYFKSNKTDGTYSLQNGSFIKFQQSEDPQKIQGASYDIVWLEEAVELQYNVFRQLNLRLKDGGKMLISFNPSDPNTWINQHLEQQRQNDICLIKSSYLDNPFLSDTQIQEIEYLKDTDKNYWLIYGQGEYGIVENQIFPDFEEISDFEFEEIGGQTVYGLDVGFSNCSALTKVKYSKAMNAVFIKEILYKKGLQNDAISEACKDERIRQAIYIDSAAASTKKLLLNDGFLVRNANKKSVTDRLQYCKGLKIYITKSSSNLLSEMKFYKLATDKSGNVTDKPVKFNDHLIDSWTYAAYTAFSKRSKSFNVI